MCVFTRSTTTMFTLGVGPVGLPSTACRFSWQWDSTRIWQRLHRLLSQGHVERQATISTQTYVQFRAADFPNVNILVWIATQGCLGIEPAAFLVPDVSTQRLPTVFPMAHSGDWKNCWPFWKYFKLLSTIIVRVCPLILISGFLRITTDLFIVFNAQSVLFLGLVAFPKGRRSADGGVSALV